MSTCVTEYVVERKVTAAGVRVPVSSLQPHTLSLYFHRYEFRVSLLSVGPARAGAGRLTRRWCRTAVIVVSRSRSPARFRLERLPHEPGGYGSCRSSDPSPPENTPDLAYLGWSGLVATSRPAKSLPPPKSGIRSGNDLVAPECCHTNTTCPTPTVADKFVGELGAPAAGVTVAVAALVSVSVLPPSSSKVTRTLRVLPRSASTRV